MRDLILSEIRRLAAAENGRPPGKAAFARETGIAEHRWSGTLWARWSDALAEAGFTPNSMQPRFDSEDVLSKLIEACRHYGRVPTVAELKLYRVRNPNFPSKGALAGHFRSRSALLSALADRAAASDSLSDIATMVAHETMPIGRTSSSQAIEQAEGLVYLLKSGEHYKVGRSDNLERRIREIRVALPEAASLVHVIRTDDPPGIEAYWHRRFSDRRANGEWFKLSAADIRAFKRRKFQ